MRRTERRKRASVMIHVRPLLARVLVSLGMAKYSLAGKNKRRRQLALPLVEKETR